MRKKATLIIEGDLLKRAQALGIDVSRLCEKVLRFYIDAMEKTDAEVRQRFFGAASFTKEGAMEPRAGFEPATYSLQGCRSGQLSYRGTLV